LTTVYHTEAVNLEDRDALLSKLMLSSAAPLSALAKEGRLVFKPVARVEGASLDEAFLLTNSIDGPWPSNPSVTKLFDGEDCRSTSVGDIIEIDGIYRVVTIVGFDIIDLNIASL
jgi:hypothetical protein